MEDQNDTLSENLPAGMEGRESIVSKFGSIEELAKSYHNLSKKLSETKRVPSTDAPKEEWSHFYQELGAPTTPDGYGVPAEVPDSLTPVIGAARQAAHQNGLTTDQFKNILSPFLKREEERTVEEQNKQEEAKEKWRQEAKEKYGAKYENNAALAERAYNQVIKENPALESVFEKTGMGYNPEVMDFMVRMGTEMSDEQSPKGISNENFGTDYRSLAARARKIAKLGAINNPRNPDYEEHTNEFMEIQKALLEEGYNGMNDPRLQSDTAWIRGR